METDAAELSKSVLNGDPADIAFVVAGLGASAGGVEALEAFFAGLPEVDGVAFVVVLHLAPDEESRLANVLQGGLPLPVIQVTEAVTIEPGHVYVIPPGKNLLARGARLVLEPIEEERVRRRPIDHFFRTLAYAYGERAVGVVLSGTGANGTVGVRAVKEAGGMILAQDPDDAAFDEMPRTAIASGVVDGVGPAGALAAEVAAYAHRLRRVHLPDAPADLPGDGAKALQGVLSQLRARTGHDFAHYKRATVLRRLDRRLHVTGADSLSDYLERLRGDAAEAQALLDDLLISVTNFFRDPSAFVALAAAVPRLVEGKGPDGEVRVWVPGCATGEEAYSVAMLLLEHAATLAEPPRVQVFATDLSEGDIQTARAGAYPESIEADVSPERLRRFFVHENGRYRVAEPLREAVLFAPHSLLEDPPFSRLDLVSCRNLLIYFQRDLQRRALALFHHALRPGGLLFLGSSESSASDPDLFSTLDKKARLYRRLDVATPALALPHVPRVLTVPPASGPAPAPRAEERPPSQAEALHRRLREQTAPPSVLVGEAGDVAHVSDGAAAFLQVPSGAPTRTLVKILRPELRAAVQSALFQARRDGRPAEAAPAELVVDGEARPVRVQARPDPQSGLVQVVFDVLPAAPASSAPSADGDGALAQALHQTQEQLQVSVEEFETTREELRAQNEELQSINEELRSTAEELETSKEEAQSMAEELRTVNDELKAKVDETARAKGDLENLIVSTEIATLFLDRDLRIQRFTPRVRDLFHVLPSDVGRPLADLAQRFGGGRLAEDAEAVLARLETTEREVEGEDGRWYLVQARPYRSVEDRIDGVVVTFVDITRRKTDEAVIRASADRAAFRAALADALREQADPLAVQAAAARLLGRHLGASRVQYGEVDGPAVVMAPDYADGVPSLSGRYELDAFGPALAGALRAGRTLVMPDLDAEGDLSDDARAAHAGVGVAAQVVVPLGEDGRLRAVLAVHQSAPRDWTAAEVALVEETAERTRAAVERARAQAALRASEALFDVTISTISDFVYAFDRDGRFVFVNRPLLDLWGLGLADAVGRTFHELDYPADLADRHQREIDHVFETGEGLTNESVYVGADGREGTYEYIFRPLLDDDGAVALVVGSTRDVTERRRAEAALRQSEDRLRQVAETVPDVLFRTTADGTVDFVNHQFEALTGRPLDAVLGSLMWPDLVHPDDRERVEGVWAQARASGEPYETRYRLLTPRRPRWVITRAHPFADAEGAVAAWFGTVTDVDALARAEDEVRQLNASLAERVAERTEQVRDLSARLTAAEEHERQRIALVLHDDLQQQLAGLAMVLSVMRRSVASDADRGLHARAAEIVDGASALTRSLASEMSPPSLASDDFAETVRWLAGRKRDQHQLEVAVEGGPCEVPDHGVRALLYQALRELLFNVVKHAGTGRATVRARRDGADVVVEVEDDGDGFDGDAPTASDGGLGLFSVRERIERAGGRLDLDAQPGRGTRATITVPAGD